MDVFKYKFFKTNDEFIKWQCEGERKITQIQPMPLSMDGCSSGDFSESNFNLSFGVFIVYIEDLLNSYKK